MVIKILATEYSWLGRRLSKLATSSQGRSVEQANLIKETAAKFSGSRDVDADGNLLVPIQRRHLRLLEEVQKLSVRAIKDGTLKELDNRIAEGKGDPGYYAAKRAEAIKMLEENEALLAKLVRYL